MIIVRTLINLPYQKGHSPVVATATATATAPVDRSFNQLVSAICPLTALIFSCWTLTTVQVWPSIAWRTSLKPATCFKSTEKLASDKLQTVVLVYTSIHSALRPAIVSIDHVSKGAFTIDHTHHWSTEIAVVTTESTEVTIPCIRLATKHKRHIWSLLMAEVITQHHPDTRLNQLVWSMCRHMAENHPWLVKVTGRLQLTGKTAKNSSIYMYYICVSTTKQTAIPFMHTVTGLHIRAFCLQGYTYAHFLKEQAVISKALTYGVLKKIIFCRMSN